MTTVVSPAWIEWPAKAAFGRVLPKAKIYEHGDVNARLKDLFVKQVEQMVWACKLAPDTLNLAARPGVPEIQVFSVQLKTADLHRDVLRCIDSAIPYPILFELGFDGRTQVVAAYKRPSESDGNRWVVSDYFSTDWLPANGIRSALPVALHLGGLYEQLLRRLIPLPARERETLAELVTRVEQAQAKQRELERVAARVAKEMQFNRRVEINTTLHKIKLELKALIC